MSAKVIDMNIACVPPTKKPEMTATRLDCVAAMTVKPAPLPIMLTTNRVDR